MKKRPEILAPAGSIKGLKAAINAGCDAIYIGGSHFGARAFADNPEEDEMLQAIEYCHLHQVKIYMTVNTLLKNKEMEEILYQYLLPYYQAGLDAVIVQDVGVLKFISSHFPTLAIHASTQMTITMGKSASILQKYHVNRIVPARELSLEELVQMRKDTQLELEVFIHGALCYCYSGQCLFSSMQGGRSGNRGRCAQPCRMQYFIDGNRNANGDYLLSPKELCNLPYLDKMIEAGIDSFKIEGRMKRPEYTAFVTAMYRKYVDIYFKVGKENYRNYIKKHKKEWEEDLRKLAELYNREGFTQGYLEGKSGNLQKIEVGKKGEMLSQMRPKHGGTLVGEVLSVNSHEVIYQTICDLKAQDVVEFRNKWQRPTYEYTLGANIKKGTRVSARYQKGSKITKGDKVYRTKDALLLKEIQDKYIDQKKQQPVRGYFVGKVGKKSMLTISFYDFKVSVEGDICSEAQKQTATKESIQKALNQTGNSDFYFQELMIDIDSNVFLPVGVIKKIRRAAFEKMKETITNAYIRSDAQSNRMDDSILLSRKADGKKAEIAVAVMNQEQLTVVLDNAQIDIILLHTEQISFSEIKNAYEKIRSKEKKAGLILPVIFRKEIWKEYECEAKKENGIFSLNWNEIVVKNMEEMAFLDELVGFSRKKIRLDANVYVFNNQASKFWMEQGIDKFTISLEATKEEIASYSFNSNAEIMVYGKTLLMVSAQCIMKNVNGCMRNNLKKRNTIIEFTDQRNREFEAMNCCRYCYNLIYQKEALDLRAEWKNNQMSENHRIRYEFSTESAREVEGILNEQSQRKTTKGHWNLGIE